MKSKSLLQDEKKCFVTGSQQRLDCHHVYAGSCRKLSDKWGCWVWLRHDIHMEVHNGNTALDHMLKRVCQEAFEQKYSHEQFMSIFGRNWL